ncbi:hypothetical protein [Pseudomonas abieticivorans]|uniref:hypothetical protein n=1 Tax=Pseudomonas abieticivorans TaxID=2931382 RepID=UPI0020BEBCD2|nr:hypothetical protein [Pseudomonas sp. PIA16]
MKFTGSFNLPVQNAAGALTLTPLHAIYPASLRLNCNQSRQERATLQVVLFDQFIKEHDYGCRQHNVDLLLVCRAFAKLLAAPPLLDALNDGLLLVFFKFRSVDSPAPRWLFDSRPARARR